MLRDVPQSGLCQMVAFMMMVVPDNAVCVTMYLNRWPAKANALFSIFKLHVRTIRNSGEEIELRVICNKRTKVQNAPSLLFRFRLYFIGNKRA